MCRCCLYNRRKKTPAKKVGVFQCPLEISLSADSAGLFFGFLGLFSVAGAVWPSKFAPPFNDSRQSLKGLNKAGAEPCAGAITLASNGVLVSGRYRHGKPRKPVNPPLSALHSFEIYIIFVCF